MNLKCLISGHDWDGHTDESYPPPKCKRCGEWHKRKEQCKNCKWFVVCQANFGKTKKDVCHSGMYERK